MIVRFAEVADASDIVKLLRKIDSETEFLLYLPDERITTVQEQKRIVQNFINVSNSQYFLAVDKDLPVGFLTAYGGRAAKNRHSAQIVTGVLKSYCHQGIGTMLFKKLLEWAPYAGIKRLELTVMEHNIPAISLYEKMGFCREGIRKSAILLNNRYIDEFYMSKII